MDKINPQEQTRDTSASKKSPTKDFAVEHLRRPAPAAEQRLPQNRLEAARGSTSSPKDLTINSDDRYTSGHPNGRLQTRQPIWRERQSRPGDYGTSHSRQSQSKQVWRPKLSDQGTSSSSERPPDAGQKDKIPSLQGGSLFGFGQSIDIKHTGPGVLFIKNRRHSKLKHRAKPTDADQNKPTPNADQNKPTPNADQNKPLLKGGGEGVKGFFGSATNITNAGAGAVVYKSRDVRISGVDDSSEQQKKK